MSNNYKMQRIFLLLGTNLGNKAENLLSAMTEMQKRGITIVRASARYETAAWGKKDQPSFYNQALEVSTSYDPYALLKILLDTELSLGRIRQEKWAERNIDIDILLYGSEIIDSPTLMIPHPQLPFRRFVLIPLSEIASTFVHPVSKKKISELLAECPDQLAVSKISEEEAL